MVSQNEMSWVFKILIIFWLVHSQKCGLIPESINTNDSYQRYSVKIENSPSLPIQSGVLQCRLGLWGPFLCIILTYDFGLHHTLTNPYRNWQ